MSTAPATAATPAPAGEPSVPPPADDATGSSEGGPAAAAGAGGAAGAGSAGAKPTGVGPSTRPDSYLLVYNVSKAHNVGNIVRSSCAFGVKEVVVVGDRKIKGFGAMGTMKHMKFSRHESLADAVRYLKDRGVRICGVEILPEAKAVNTHPFSGSTAFMLGNEGHGLNEKQKAVCDEYVYIPHYGNGTASLNVTVAGSIVLHHFGVWAGYAERVRDDEAEAKYLVEVQDRSVAPRTTDELALRQKRQAEAEERVRAAAAAASGAGDLFGDSDDSDSDGSSGSGGPGS